MTTPLVQWLNPKGIGFIFDPAITQHFGAAGSIMAAFFVFCLGACLGSFANACAMRLVRVALLLVVPAVVPALSQTSVDCEPEVSCQGFAPCC